MRAELPFVEPAARDALRHAVAQLDAAETRSQPFEMSQALAGVARCYRALHALTSAEAAFAAALRWAHHAGSRDQAVDLMCELAETAALHLRVGDDPFESDGRVAHAARERARDHAFEAARLAGQVADPGWEVQVLLRASRVLESCGDHGDALRLQQRALQRGGGRAGTPTDLASP
jgi:tetratricopeptide (TPR) repeat protein